MTYQAYQIQMLQDQVNTLTGLAIIIGGFAVFFLISTFVLGCHGDALERKLAERDQLLQRYRAIYQATELGRAQMRGVADEAIAQMDRVVRRRTS